MAVLVGVFDANDQEEIANCKSLLQDERLLNTIVGVVVGTENLTFRRARMDAIEAAIEELRAVRDVPLTTTEIVQAYGNDRLVKASEFLCVNIHAVFSGKFTPTEGANWAMEQVESLLDVAPKDRLTVVRELGWPSGPLPFSDEQQIKYWETVLKHPTASKVNLFLFDAGLNNAKWKTENIKVPGGEEVNIGPHWPVLFTEGRARKPNADKLLRLWKATRTELNVPGD